MDRQQKVVTVPSVPSGKTHEKQPQISLFFEISILLGLLAVVVLGLGYLTSQTPRSDSQPDSPVIIAAPPTETATMTATVTATSSATATRVPTRRPTSTPTVTPSPTLYIPSEITVEFGREVSVKDRASILSTISKALAFYKANGFGGPGQTLVFVSNDTEALVDKSYEVKSTMFPEEPKEEYGKFWARGGGMQMVVGGKGYEFLKPSFQYWSVSVWEGSDVTRGQCTVAHELLHLIHQRLSGVNFMNNGSLPRTPSDSGPAWIREGTANVVCAYIYDIPEDDDLRMLERNLALVPSDVTFKEAVAGDPNLSSDQFGYMQEYAVHLLIKESPGGKKEGVRSIATFFRGLADESKTWQEVFAETWGWTLEEFYKEFEARR